VAEVEDEIAFFHQSGGGFGFRDLTRHEAFG